MYTEKGIVIAVLDIKAGTSAKGPWKKQSFVIKTDGQYPKAICFDVFASGDKQLTTPHIGQSVDVSFSVESREYNGNYYTNASAFKIEVSGSVAQQNAVKAPEFTPLPPSDDVRDDLPF